VNVREKPPLREKARRPRQNVDKLRWLVGHCSRIGFE
jgi:hypothetical protein